MHCVFFTRVGQGSGWLSRILGKEAQNGRMEQVSSSSETYIASSKSYHIEIQPVIRLD